MEVKPAEANQYLVHGSKGENYATQKDLCTERMKRGIKMLDMGMIGLA